MAYTMEQYKKDYFMETLSEFIEDASMKDGILDRVTNRSTADDIFARMLTRGRLSVDKVLSYFSPAQLVERLSPDERLEGLSPDERLEGLSPDEIQAYLHKLEQTSNEIDDNTTQGEIVPASTSAELTETDVLHSTSSDIEDLQQE